MQRPKPRPSGGTGGPRRSGTPAPGRRDGRATEADATGLRCPACRRALTRHSANHARTFGTRFGPGTVRRTRGFCKRCGKWRVPADTPHDEALLCLEMFWRNDRWHLLFPHTLTSDPARN